MKTKLYARYDELASMLPDLAQAFVESCDGYVGYKEYHDYEAGVTEQQAGISINEPTEEERDLFRNGPPLQEKKKELLHAIEELESIVRSL